MFIQLPIIDEFCQVTAVAAVRVRKRGKHKYELEVLTNDASSAGLCILFLHNFPDKDSAYAARDAIGAYVKRVFAQVTGPADEGDDAADETGEEIPDGTVRH